MTLPHAADTFVPGARNVASLHAVSRTSPFTHGQNAVMQPWTSSRVAKPRRCRAREGRRCASAGPKKGGGAPTGRWRTLVAWGRCGSPSKLCWAACRPAGRCSRGLIAGCQRPWWPLITGLAAEALLVGSAGWRPTIKRNGPSYEGVPTNSASAFGSIILTRPSARAWVRPARRSGAAGGRSCVSYYTSPRRCVGEGWTGTS